MDIRFTAWITTDATCLKTENCDVTVLIDQITSYSEGECGEEVAEWESTGPEVFSAVTTIPCNGDHKAATDESEALLNAAGWGLTSGWEAVPTGYIATVTR